MTERLKVADKTYINLTQPSIGRHFSLETFLRPDRGSENGRDGKYAISLFLKVEATGKRPKEDLDQLSTLSLLHNQRREYFYCR